MSVERREQIKNAFFWSWGIALALRWLTPDDSVAWDVVTLAVAGLWLLLLVVLVVDWVRRRHRGDRNPDVESRVVFGLGAAVAVGAGVLVESLADSTTIATVVMVALLVPALVASVRVASRPESGPPSRSR